MILKLKDIATVSSGVTFRSRIEASKDGCVRLIQMKDLGDDNSVHLRKSIQIDHPMLKPHQLAQLGDIIFRSFGQTRTAALLREDAENVIVAAPLLRVRPDATKIRPEFLLWWINQPSVQSYLASRSAGTMMKMISKQSLEGLEVHLPSLKQQKHIADVFNLSMQEQQILEQIKHHRALYTHGRLMQMVAVNPKQPGFDSGNNNSRSNPVKNKE